MRRIRGLVVVLVLIGGLAACSDDDDGGGGTNNPPPSTGSPPAGGDGSGGATGQGGGGTGDGTGTGGDTGGTGGGDTGGTGGGGVGPVGGAPGGGGGGGAPGGGGGGAPGGGGGGAPGGGGASAQHVSPAPAANAEIAMDAAGNAIAVWEQSDGNIYFSRYSGAAWSAPTLLETLDTPATQPQIAMNNAGNAMAVWVQPPAAGAGNYTFARYFSGGSWQAPVVISDEPFASNDAPLSQKPRVAIDDSGTALATWEEQSFRVASVGLIGNAFRPGSGWVGDEVLHRAIAYESRIAMDGKGNGVVAYLHDPGDGDTARVLHYTAGSGWGTSIELARAFVRDIHVSMNTTGEALVAWAQYDFRGGVSPFDVRVSRYVGGAWTAPQAIEVNDTGDSSQVWTTLAGNGNATVVWRKDDAGVNNVYAARLEGGTWLQPTLVGQGVEPRVASPGNGPVIAWLRGSDVMLSHYSGSNNWQAPQNVESNAEAAQGVRLTSSSHANAFALWRQLNGVWARLLP